jgi:hypothetical protein
MHIVVQIIFIIMGSVLSVVLTRLLIRNGRALIDLGRRMDEGHRILSEGLSRIEEGQRRGFAILEEGHKEIAKILSDHTRILERIEGKLR